MAPCSLPDGRTRRRKPGRAAWLFAVSFSAQVAGAAPGIFEADQQCLFEVPLKSGKTLVADAPPLRAFGKLLVKREGRTITLDDADVAAVSKERERQWDVCESWRALDSHDVRGSSLPGWPSLAPEAWRSVPGPIFVYVFWGWCEPCMVSLEKVRALAPEGGRQGLRVLIVPIDSNHEMWARAFAKHGFIESPTLHVAYLSEEPFQRISEFLHRDPWLAIAALTDQSGCVLHSDLRPFVAVDITRRVLEAGERCQRGTGKQP